MQAHAPEHRTARPYNIIVGHCVGLCSGFFFVWIFGLTNAPSVFQAQAVTASRVWATVLAIFVAAMLEVLLRAAHPPGAATTLLASLGSFKPTWNQAGHIAVGVIIVTAVGEVVRQYRLHGRAEEASG
jgi:CBS-domain-containing membrane protein